MFGVPTINLKTILKQLGKIFDHKDVAVRNMVINDKILKIRVQSWLLRFISG